MGRPLTSSQAAAKGRVQRQGAEPIAGRSIPGGVVRSQPQTLRGLAGSQGDRLRRALARPLLSGQK
jgi:hypothetical protein